MTDALDLDAIRARAEAATPGLWHGPHDGEFGCVVQGDFGWVTPGLGPEYDQDTDQGQADAEFIAHARQDVPDLLAEVERLRQHSITLNSLGWRMAEALGQVPEGADAVRGTPDDQLSALIAERDEARDEVVRLRASLARYQPPASGGTDAPTYGQIADAWQQTLDQQDERRRSMREMGAELRKVEAERDKALAQVSRYEGAICWDTTCLSCATVLDSMHRETERREQAEAAIGRVRAAVHVADPEDVTDWQRGYRACSLRVVETLDEFANGGTVQSGPVLDESGCALTVPPRQTSDTSADPVGPASGAQGPWHLGRAWHGHDIEDACPCPQAPCGLVVDRTRDPNCAQHGRFGRTIRQGHPAARCPEAGSTESEASDGR